MHSATWSWSQHQDCCGLLMKRHMRNKALLWDYRPVIEIIAAIDVYHLHLEDWLTCILWSLGGRCKSCSRLCAWLRTRFHCWVQRLRQAVRISWEWCSGCNKEKLHCVSLNDTSRGRMEHQDHNHLVLHQCCCEQDLPAAHSAAGPTLAWLYYFSRWQYRK